MFKLIAELMPKARHVPFTCDVGGLSSAQRLFEGGDLVVIETVDLIEGGAQSIPVLLNSFADLILDALVKGGAGVGVLVSHVLKRSAVYPPIMSIAVGWEERAIEGGGENENDG